ncbi:MAG: efflux transporter outer membrane subunit [Syntrophus sp. SKADARSKE-3]|nr:efflux transporter outer membrane subunit [Syntrophus sp. SKADARSKE-3]
MEPLWQRGRVNEMKRLLPVLCLLVMVLGCTIGKDYKRPEITSPKMWRFEEGEVLKAANAAWWDQFADPVLNELISAALVENKDLLIATARIEEYMGRYGVTRAGQFPQVGAQIDAGRQRITETGYSPIPSTISPTYYNFQGTLNASWELDLWGKLRRATEAAKADLLSKEENRRAVMLTLTSSVAYAYVNLLNLDEQLRIARQTTKSRKESLNLFNLRFEGGVISELELNQVKSEYEQARALIPQLEKAIIQQENAMNLLLGRNPGPIKRGRTMAGLVLPAIPEGLPSDLLERRPDIRQSEQDLISANAQIGVAKAAYFPTISLTGYFGAASTELSTLFTGPAKVWSWGGSLTMPIFTAGKIKGQVQVAEAIQKQALYRYQQAIQTAFREVEDSLADRLKSGEKLEAEGKQVAALRNYRDLATLRYENGYSSYLEVLDAERSLFNAELSYTQTQGIQFQALVSIYKAMGGGWEINGSKNLKPTGPQVKARP